MKKLGDFPLQVGSEVALEWATDCTPEAEQICPPAVTAEVNAKVLIGTALAAIAEPLTTPLSKSRRREASIGSLPANLAVDELADLSVSMLLLITHLTKL